MSNCVYMFVFFKQKTAYEVRISDCSSDVCSSDLLSALPRNSLHQSFDWCHAWWNSHGRAPLVVRGRLDGRTVMILPLDVTSTGGFRIAFLAGSRFNNLNTGLFSADFPTPAAAELQILGDALRP